MEVVAAAATSVGLVREQNEDSFYCGRTVFAVADGLGGHAAGEVASALAVEPVAALDDGPWGAPAEARGRLVDAVQGANRAVLEAAERDETRRGMATTLTVAAVVDGTLVLAHVGDSRGYLLGSDRSLRRLTTDHTAAQEAVASGLLSPDEAERVPERHLLARAIGLSSDVRVDTLGPVRLAGGDRVLLCSDGLTEVVSDDDITDILAAIDDPRAAADQLVATALSGGGPDNVTVVVLHLAATP